MRIKTTTMSELDRLDDAAMLTRAPRLDELAAMQAGCPKHGGESMNYNDDGTHCMACVIATLVTIDLPALAGAR
jgi:hypothetical protein